MMIFLVLCIVILSIVASYLLALVVLYKKQYQKMKQQIEFILEHKTNMKITLKNVQTKEIVELAKSINDLMEAHRELEIELQRADKNFKETITNISHDLRTPLTSANGYVQMLNSSKLSEEKRKEYVEVIQSKIDTVKVMLDQLFEYARIESNELLLENERINVKVILEDTISEFYQDFISRRIEPKIELESTDRYIYGDKQALKRVFQNLIGNSIIHGKGEVCISLYHEQNTIKIIFENRTEGIEVADMNRIFERFYTTDKSRTKKTTGLGLSIASKFVKKMNGTIQAELQANKLKMMVSLKEAT